MEIPRQLCWNVKKLKEVKPMKIHELENWTMLAKAGTIAIGKERLEGRQHKRDTYTRCCSGEWKMKVSINLDLTSLEIISPCSP